MIPLLRKIMMYKMLKINAIKYSELVYPVHHKGGAPIMHPNCPHEGQDQGQARREKAQHLVAEAHSLGCGQRRVSHFQDSLAGRQGLLEAAVLSDEVLIKKKFLSFTQNKRIVKNEDIKK